MRCSTTSYSVNYFGGACYCYCCCYICLKECLEPLLLRWSCCSGPVGLLYGCWLLLPLPPASMTLLFSPTAGPLAGASLSCCNLCYSASYLAFSRSAQIASTSSSILYTYSRTRSSNCSHFRAILIRSAEPPPLTPVLFGREPMARCDWP